MTATDEWNTPKWLADALGPFDLDPCSNASSHVQATITCSLDGHERGSRPDGLTFDWGRLSTFANFPYSKPLPWCERLASHDGPWVALVKLDPTTKWWATLMSASPTVAPFRKRIKFEGPQSMTANFPSVLVYSAWRPPVALRPHLWLATYSEAA